MNRTNAASNEVNTMEEKKKNGEVIRSKIYGTDEKGKNNLYFIMWRRIANSGTVMCWAKDEKEAVKNYGYSTDHVLHTVVKIDPESLPVEYGIETFHD